MKQKVYVVLMDWYPHNSDAGCAAKVFGTYESAKKYVEKDVKSYVRCMKPMEYVNWDYDDRLILNECNVCTDREDYAGWKIVEEIVKY